MIGRVCQLPAVSSRENRNSFQTKLSVIIEVAISPGRAIGSTISRKMRKRGTSSTSAASSISTGSAWKKSRISQTTIGSENAV